MKPIVTVLLLTTVLIVLMIACVLVLPWMLLYLGIAFSPDPPRPEITRGEFPFRLEYEIDGKRVVIEDTLICEFDGFGMNEGAGKYRKWKGRLASGNEEVVLFEPDLSDSPGSDDGVVKKYIFFPVGSPNYYMGDPGEYETFGEFRHAVLYERHKNGITKSSLIREDELLETYKIRLIGFEHAEPIQNRFVEKG